MLIEKTRRNFGWIGKLPFGLDAELIDPIAIFPGTPAARAILAGASLRQGVTTDWAAEEFIFSWGWGTAIGNRSGENTGGDLSPCAGRLEEAVYCHQPFVRNMVLEPVRPEERECQLFLQREASFFEQLADCFWVKIKVQLGELDLFL